MALEWNSTTLSWQSTSHPWKSTSHKWNDTNLPWKSGGGGASPDITAPTITSTNTVSINENVQLSHTLSANEPVTWSISGGADSGDFELSGNILRWVGNGAMDYDAPLDADTNNAYVVQVTATDAATNATNQTITVTVLDVDDVAPTITSSDTTSVEENATLVHSLTASETVTWSIVGGADQAQFEISGSTLRWLNNDVRDYESPSDADLDNAYVVQVRATDTALNATNQTITVTVTDVSEGTTTAGEPMGLLLVLTKAA